MKNFLVVMLTLFFTGSAFSDINQLIALCAAKSGELERLECYDGVATKYNLAAPVQKASQIEGRGKWEVSDSINPIDDSRTVVLSLFADSGQNQWGKPIPLIIMCKSNKTHLYISWQDYLGGEVSVLTRVGSAKATTRKWSMSTNNQASFYPGSTIPFIRSLFEVDKLVAQVTPYNESPVTAIFDIKGLINAAVPLMETCGWTAQPSRKEKEKAAADLAREKASAEAAREAKEAARTAAIAERGKNRCIQAKQHVTDLANAGLGGSNQYKEAVNQMNSCENK